MPNEQLLSYVREQMAKRVGRAEISRALLGSGWPIQDINNVLIALSVPMDMGSVAVAADAAPPFLPPMSAAPVPSTATPVPASAPIAPTAPVAVVAPAAPLPAQPAARKVPVLGIVIGVVVLAALGGAGWWFSSTSAAPMPSVSLNAPSDSPAVADKPSTQGAEEWTAAVSAVSGELKEYRNEELGFGFKVPANVHVEEESLGKYAIYSFWVANTLGGGDGDLKTRQTVGALAVNGKDPTEAQMQASTGKYKYTQEDSSVGGVAATKYVMTIAGMKMTGLVTFGQNGNKYTFLPGYDGNEKDKDLYKTILGSIFFFSGKDTHPSVTYDDFTNSLMLDAKISELINRASVYGEAYHGPSRGYGEAGHDCFASTGLFADPNVHAAMMELKATGVSDITCYVTPAGFAISVHRPESFQTEGVYKCQDNHSGTTGQCGINQQISGPSCGTCVDACHAGPDKVIC